MRVDAVTGDRDNGRMTTPSSRRPVRAPLADWRRHLHLSDIRGLAQLATQGTLGITELVERVQGNVYKAVAAPFGAAGQKFVDRTAGTSGVRQRGITGLVYGSVKGVTRLAGGGVDALLSRVAPRAGPQASSPQREALLAALNGVLGDQLLDTANPLAIRMSLRHDGQSLPLEQAALAQRLPHATGKILLLVHGLCMNDLQWRADSPADALPGHARDYGEALAHELGYTPVYLHYNTGLHTSVNGGQFAALLEQLLQAWPQEVETLSLLTHSMGGLVARSRELGGHCARQQPADPAVCQNRPDPQRRHHRPAPRQCAAGRLAGRRPFCRWVGHAAAFAAAGRCGLFCGGRHAGRCSGGGNDRAQVR
jgi:hypothetical protein